MVRKLSQRWYFEFDNLGNIRVIEGEREERERERERRRKRKERTQDYKKLRVLFKISCNVNR